VLHLVAPIAVLMMLCQRPAFGLSPLYDYTVIARDGLQTAGGDDIVGIKPEVSVNEHGWVAFIGTKDPGSNLYAGHAPCAPINISMSVDARQFGFPQINNHGTIVARELLAGNSVVRTWRLANPGDFTLLASTTLSAFSQLTLPTIGNMAFANSVPIVGFLGREEDLPFAYYVNDSGERDMQDCVSRLSGTVLTSFRSMAAASDTRTFVAQYSTQDDNGRVVVFSQPDDLSPWESTLIATTVGSEWLDVGITPGISDNGKVVAFVGDSRTQGLGIYVAVTADRFTNSFTLLPAIRTTDVIAYDTGGNPIALASFDLVNRVGAMHYEVGKPGLEEDSIVLAFVATPSQASRPNPALPGKPLLFSDKQGIWTLRVDIERELYPPGGANPLRLHPSTPVSVAQVGDTIDGGVVESLTLYDPLAMPLEDADGFPRIPQRGDQYVAFSALTDAGVKVVRAAMLDTDGDGLMDHWETRGIDVDHDGNADLKLHRMGADPLHKDIFLEIDWLADRTKGSYKPWSNQPAPYATHRMAQMFADAPATNPDGTTGITMHVDAGPGLDATGYPFSVNMPDDPFLLDGGDVIGMPGNPKEHIDLVHFGKPGSLSITGLVTRDFGSIKDEYFGTHDKRAREFAFKYAVLADCWGMMRKAGPYVTLVSSATATQVTAASDTGAQKSMRGHVLKIVTGKGAGQVREITHSLGKQLTVWPGFEEVPDSSSSFVVMSGSSGLAEVSFQREPDYHSRPANDFMMTLGGFGINDGGWLSNAMIQWRTLAHELGHTLGLRHGGTDHEEYKGDLYTSIMSYSYQTKVDSGVDSYGELYPSGGGNPVFDDWAYIKHDFQHTGYFLGNTFGQSPGETAADYPDPTVKDYEELNNAPVDLTPPTVAISSPAPGATVPNGGALTVTATASDNVRVASVFIHFDLDGDGRASGRTEQVQAVPGGGGAYSATFNNVAGPYGARKVLAIAFDNSENAGVATTTVLAGQGAGGGTTLHQSSGTIPAQPAGGQRKVVQVAPIQVPGSGNLSFTVSSTFPVRQKNQVQERHDSSVQKIQFDGKYVNLVPVCNPPGSDPALCSSYWQAPAAGTLNIEILGPAVFDQNGNFLGTPAQNYTLNVAFKAVDMTPPELTITWPSEGGFVEVAETLVVELHATDDYGLQSVVVAFDINGDGHDYGVGERVVAGSLGGGNYRATFANVSGAPGTRPIHAVATDSAGHMTSKTGFVEVRVPDIKPPQATIKAPPPGWPIKQGETLKVEVYAYDDIQLASVTVAFDINGNGNTADAGESLDAVKTGVNLYTASLTSISGPNGARTVNVTAADTSGNTSPASVPVTVGGLVPTTQTIFTHSGHINAQSWSGAQQVIPYDPIQIPGSGTLTFTVTATPPVRQEVQNITRQDPYVRHINFNGQDHNLTRSCNAFGADPSICTTTFEATEGGTLDFEILGPGTWNSWGEFSGHHAQDYTIEIKFTSVDITRPQVTFLSPEMGASVDLGAPLVVDVSAVDAGQIASVVVSFDVNGDADTDDFGEQLAAARIAGDNYRATFAELSGIPGTRTIEVLATDMSFNTTHKSMTVGADGVGAGETFLFTSSGTIPAQPSQWSGGQRQIIPFDPIAVPGMGRITFVITATPNVRQEFQNLERHDPTVVKINFNGQDISLTPVCNPPGSNPAVAVSVWDSPGAGQLDFEILGPAVYNTWGEFDGHPEQHYTIEVLFIPGPSVTQVTPNKGSVGGHETVTVRGSGFAFNAVVLFGQVAATNVIRFSSEELICTTPPGVPGSVTVTVLNADPGNEPWNYGGPYGLFGELQNGFTYQAAPPPAPLQAERLLGTYKGYFPAVGSEEPQQAATFTFTIPSAAGRLRFEAYAFVPILNPIPGPFDDPDNLDWHNESTAVRGFTGGNNANYAVDVESSDLSYPYGPVICNSTRIIASNAAGSGRFTVKGPARWNAFWRQFGEYEMVSAPAQNWSIAVWFGEPPSLASVSPKSGSEAGGDTVTLTGSNFAEGIQVRFGGRLAMNVVVSSKTTLTCKTPPGTPGLVSVEVELLDMTASLNNAFTYQPDAQRKAISRFSLSAQGTATVWVKTQTGKTYQLQRNDDLTNPYGWLTLGAEIAGNGAEQAFTDTTVSPYSRAMFYRIIIRSTQP
jgi:hypothetical protein